jgi:hypothetical protein
MDHSMKMEIGYPPFWYILKINIVRELEVCMANYSRIFNILRIENTNIILQMIKMKVNKEGIETIKSEE